MGNQRVSLKEMCPTPAPQPIIALSLPAQQHLSHYFNPEEQKGNVCGSCVSMGLCFSLCSGLQKSWPWSFPGSDLPFPGIAPIFYPTSALLLNCTSSKYCERIRFVTQIQLQVMRMQIVQLCTHDVIIISSVYNERVQLHTNWRVHSARDCG